MVFSCVSETSNLIPQPGYTHGTAPVPTALPPAHPVSCAKRHFHERIIFCNRGVRIIHYLQTLLWQAQTSAPILHGQQSDLESLTDSANHPRRNFVSSQTIFKPLCRIIMARNGFRPLCHTAKRKYIGMCACPIQFVMLLYNLFSKNQRPQFGYL